MSNELMKDADNAILLKGEDFALRIVNLYIYLTEKAKRKEFVLSKQVLRSGTSIGANIAEAEYAISRDDFKAKLYISMKECNETRYWLNLLCRSHYLTKEEFNSIYPDCIELLKLLTAITKTTKSTHPTH